MKVTILQTTGSNNNFIAYAKSKVQLKGDIVKLDRISEKYEIYKGTLNNIPLEMQIMGSKKGVVYIHEEATGFTRDNYYSTDKIQ